MSCEERDIGFTNRADENGANFWTPPATPADESRQSQLALVGNATNHWKDARAAAGVTLDQLLCTPPRWAAWDDDD